MARQDRVAEAIRKEVSSIIIDELKDPRLGFVTITKAEISQDMRYARVFYSVLGKDEDYKKTKQALDSALGFIRKLIAERIKLRYTPEISFKEDRSHEYSLRIQQVIEEIHQLNTPPIPVKKQPKAKKRKVIKREPKKNIRRNKKK